MLGLSRQQIVFLLKIFLNLLVQLGITYWFLERTNPKGISTLPLSIASIALIFIFVLVKMPPIIKFIVFCIFSAVMGVLMSTYKTTFSENVLQTAVKGALTIFGIMFASGLALLTTGINLSLKFGSLLLWSLIALILARLVFVSGLNMPNASKYLSYMGLMIFATYVMYDTNMILRKNYGGNFIDASMDYYLDIINLFSNILGSND